MLVLKRDGSFEPLDINKIHRAVAWACEGLDVSQSLIETNARIRFFNGIKTSEIQWALIQSAAELVDVDTPDYTYAAARMLLQSLYKQVNNGEITYGTLKSYISDGVAHSNLDPALLKHFDLDRLDAAIDPSRDFKFQYLGLKTLADRYLIRAFPEKNEKEGRLLELPQHFWMRVAMGLALREDAGVATDWAIKFYNILSAFEFVSSTPTLFNSGTRHSQMSSCYVVTIHDSIWEFANNPVGKGIMASMTECGLLSKYAGGIGADWTRVRSAGAHIKSTNGKSSGIIPYLKIFNDVAVAINQGGKRMGAFAAHLEPWHADVLQFLDLKKAVGEERSRAREIFTALWINDLFMERVRDGKPWSLFCPNRNPELCELHGEKFKIAYEAAEAKGDAVATISAIELWRKAIEALVESGGPWLSFKDESNRRYMNQHAGIVRSSNLCQEITLHTDDESTAVCNLGSLNLAVLSVGDFERVVPIAMRMLDNVIDLNFYPTEKARRSNLRFRPVGLGVMGWMDYLVRHGIDFESTQHLQIVDAIFGEISLQAILASTELARERGRYPGFEDSLWDRGVLPIDTAKELSREWLSGFEEDSRWGYVRQQVKLHGVRNGLMLAIAPTATIANIVGTTQSIEPVSKRVTMKKNLSGKFKIVDSTLRHGKPKLCKEAFEVDQVWIIRAAAVRQRWLDQSQSVNLFRKLGTKGREISAWYFLAWELGLKSTYYLRNEIAEVDDVLKPSEPEAPKFCSITGDDEGCSSCE
jgi:ribonucleoside-diphosphate reductase alpha chain